MANLQIEGLNIYYCKKGEGPETLLLLHGNVSSTEYWDKFLRILPDRYQAIALDQRGCGKSEHPADGYSIPQYVEDLGQFVDRLGLRRFHLLGHSMGGQIAMLFTLKHPERVQTLGLLDSVPADGLFLNDEIRGFFQLILKDRRALRQALGGAMPYGEGPSFAERATEIASACAPQTFTENMESMHRTNFISEVSQIAASTLILHGKDDVVIPLEYMVPTMKAMTDARVVIYTHCGHSPNVEWPREFAETYFQFIAERGKSSHPSPLPPWRLCRNPSGRT